MNYHLDQQGNIESIKYPDKIFTFDKPKNIMPDKNNLYQFVYKNDQYFALFNKSKNILTIKGINYQMHGHTIEIRHFLKNF